MWPSVQSNTILVQYAEHGAAACKSADGKDVIDAVTLVVHIDCVLFPLQLRQSLATLLSRLDILLQVDDMGIRLAKHRTLLGERTDHLHNLRGLGLGE